MEKMKTVLKLLKYLITKRCGMNCFVRNSEIPENSYLGGGTRFYSSSIGKYSYTGRKCYFFLTDIGRFSSIADDCRCGLPEHNMTYVSTSPVFCKGKNRMNKNFSQLPNPLYKKTHIGNDVWIGSGVSLKAGVSVGDGAVVGMGSVVTKDIPPYAIAAGNPARIIRYRFDDDTVKELLEASWWNKDDEYIKMAAESFSDVEKFLKDENIKEHINE